MALTIAFALGLAFPLILPGPWFFAGEAAYETAGPMGMGYEDWSDLAHSHFVRSGDGSEGNPYIVSGWEFDLTNGGNGSQEGGIDAHVVMRDNRFFMDGPGPHLQCCRALNVYYLANFTFEHNLVERVRIAYVTGTGGPESPTQWDVAFLNNNLRNLSDSGIRLSAARDFTIAGNEFFGISGPPIILYDTTTNVRVFHNNFVDNAAPVSDAKGAQNAWDDGYPSGGNYWDDYSGVDNCKGAAQNDCSGPDGIGDTPYMIDGDSQDRYPLMGPFTAPNLAPLADFSISPAAPSVNESVTLDAAQSADPEDGAVGLQFRWDLDGDGAWDTARSASASTTTTFGVSGTHTVSLEVSDADGAAANLTKSFVVVDPTLPDPHPAEVIASAPAQVETGGAIAVEVEVSDPEGVASVQIVYQAVGASSFSHADMAHVTGNRYTASLPTQTAVGVVEYYILVADGQGHQTRDPPQGTHSLKVNPAAVAERDSTVLVLAAVALAVVGVVAFTRLRRRTAR